MTRTRDDILLELAREEGRLAELERARDDARVRIASLRDEVERQLAVPAAVVVQSLPLANGNRADSIVDAVTADEGTGTRVIARGSSAPKNFVNFAIRIASIAVTYSIALVRSTVMARSAGRSG